MTLEQFAYLAEIVGVIIVVVTLLYLTVQVRQGAILLRSESRQALLSNQREVLSQYLNYVDLFDRVAKPQELSRSDQRQFSALWLMNMRNREYEWFQYRDGILDNATWLSYREIIRMILSSARHRQWWHKTKHVFDADFVTMVDAYIAEIPESNAWDEMMGAWERPA